VFLYTTAVHGRAINTGMANLPGYAVLPFIKDLKILSNGDLAAATYGSGVIKYNSGTWSQYGTGLSNLYANCLYLTTAGTLFVGTDAGVNTLVGTAWSQASTGLTANKPVRAIVADASGTMYAGLGFYVYQKGSIVGELFYSTNSGALWQTAGAGFNSTSVVCLAATSPGAVFAAACGLWQTTGPNNWLFTMTGVPLANNVLQTVKNQQGDGLLYAGIRPSPFPAVRAYLSPPIKGLAGHL